MATIEERPHAGRRTPRDLSKVRSDAAQRRQAKRTDRKARADDDPTARRQRRAHHRGRRRHPLRRAAPRRAAVLPRPRCVVRVGRLHLAPERHRRRVPLRPRAGAADGRGADDKVRVDGQQGRLRRRVERFARADPAFAVTAEMWDRDPWMLGTPGGVGRPQDGRAAAGAARGRHHEEHGGDAGRDGGLPDYGCGSCTRRRTATER